MPNHYDPNQPRNAEGEWSDAGGAIQGAASDKKRFINGGTNSWTVDKFVEWVEKDQGSAIKSGYSKLDRYAMSDLFDTYKRETGLNDEINNEGIDLAFKKLKKIGLAQQR